MLIVVLPGGTVWGALIAGALAGTLVTLVVLLRKLDLLRWHERSSIWEPTTRLFRSMGLHPYVPRQVIVNGRYRPSGGPCGRLSRPVPQSLDEDRHARRSLPGLAGGRSPWMWRPVASATGEATSDARPIMTDSRATTVPVDVGHPWRPTSRVSPSNGSGRPGADAPGARGTIAFVDISGFTKLSERLARLGKSGAEELTATIDTCFVALLDLAVANGGRLLKFGGDALLVYFSGEAHQARACLAAMEMRRALRVVGRLTVLGQRISLRMSVGVHSGLFNFFLVGESTASSSSRARAPAPWWRWRARPTPGRS